MRKAFLSSVTCLLAGTGAAWAQPWSGPTTPPPAKPWSPTSNTVAPAGHRVNWFSWPSAEERGECLPPVGPAAPTPESPYAGYPPPAKFAPPPPPCDEPMPVDCEPYPYYTWASMEQLYWQVKAARVHFPLATTGPATSTTPGVVGSPDTIVLIGNGDVNFDTASGLRVAVGLYDAAANFAIEARAFRLENLVERFKWASDDTGSPVISRPFQDVLTGIESVNLLASPGAFVGGINVSASSRFWGAEGNIGCSMTWHDYVMVDFLGGFRYFDLEEQASISDSVLVTGGGVAFFEGEPINEGQIRTKLDQFNTRNRFYGGQVGLRMGCNSGPLFLSTRAMVAVGANNASVNTYGQSTLFDTTGQLARIAQGGLYALPSNMGQTSMDKTTVIPEFEITVGCEITSCIRLFVGYNFIYWSQVVRPFDQFYPTINQTQVPISPSYGPLVGPAIPAKLFEVTDFFAQGFNFGAAIKF